MPRPMTPAEKAAFQGYFPSLDVDQVVVTGPATPVYNCIAWTVGYSDRWLWPGSSLAHFDAFYQRFGYIRSADGSIAAWGLSTASMTHGSISGPGHGPRWESKCGADLRIQHGLNELVSSSYGHVVAFYRKTFLVEHEARAFLEVAMHEKASNLSLTAAQKKALRTAQSTVPEAVRTSFERAFGAWKKTWFSGSLAINSDPHARTIGKEFDALIALGPAILPLVVEKLTDAENFFALQLYDALQPNDKLILQFGPDDERILEGEQGRALRVVKTWLTNG